VAKATGSFGTPSAINTTYMPTLTLADLTLSTGYAWNVPTTALNAGNGQTFTATFTDPSGNYETASGTITVNVAKATPLVVAVYTPPAVLYTNGTLPELTASTTVAGTIAWNAYTVTAGLQTYYWTFTPDDTENYNNATGSVQFEAVDRPFYTVTFSGEAISISPQIVEEGALAIRPDNPERAGYDFAGWFTDSGTFLNEWDFDNDIVTQDTTLYAQWTIITGITEIENASIKIYPNPVNNTLYVELENPSNGTLALFDMSGQIVLSQAINGNSGQINMSALAAGNYTLRLVENGAASAGVQVVKQ
jgi:uncharacterized repeat protein (TIGR02543 family)